MAKFVALEGIDGAGKNTLSKGLTDLASAAGRSVSVLSFPRYEETAFGRLVGRYLNGEFGPLDAVAPDFAALLYSGDRYESRTVLMSALAEFDLVIVDRYTASNLAYNAVKQAPADRTAFVAKFLQIEHGDFSLPVPDLYVLVDIPPVEATRLIGKKGERSYTDKAADLHEKDRGYLAECGAYYREMAEQNVSTRWHRVEAVQADGRLRTPEDIAAEVWAEIASLWQA